MKSVGSIDKVVVIPTYRERDSVEKFLSELLLLCKQDVAIVIADDSGLEMQEFMIQLCQNLSLRCQRVVVLDVSQRKSGRGAAVVRGFKRALSEFPTCQWFIECDADSSHRPIDIVKVIDATSTQSVTIGSRYLRESRIIGWPLTRRIFSRFLNFIVPRMLKVPVKDITNGLRGYSRSAVEILCQHDFRSKSFAALSESALVLSRQGWKFDEKPTVFINRTIGSSTVTKREVWDSFNDLIRIFILKRELEIN